MWCILFLFFITADKVDIRLHCCLRANNDECLKLCLKRYSKGGDSIQEFHKRCGFNTKEVGIKFLAGTSEYFIAQLQ